MFMDPVDTFSVPIGLIMSWVKQRAGGSSALIPHFQTRGQVIHGKPDPPWAIPGELNGQQPCGISPSHKRVSTNA